MHKRRLPVIQFVQQADPKRVATPDSQLSNSLADAARATPPAAAAAAKLEKLRRSAGADSLTADGIGLDSEEESAADCGDLGFSVKEEAAEDASVGQLGGISAASAAAAGGMSSGDDDSLTSGGGPPPAKKAKSGGNGASALKKDEKYWERRRKNNEAAKRSREKRRLNDVAMEMRIQELTEENTKLKVELTAIKKRFGLPTNSSDDAADAAADTAAAKPESKPASSATSPTPAAEVQCQSPLVQPQASNSSADATAAAASAPQPSRLTALKVGEAPASSAAATAAVVASSATALAAAPPVVNSSPAATFGLVAPGQIGGLFNFNLLANYAAAAPQSLASCGLTLKPTAVMAPTILAPASAAAATSLTAPPANHLADQAEPLDLTLCQGPLQIAAAAAMRRHQLHQHLHHLQQHCWQQQQLRSQPSRRGNGLDDATGGGDGLAVSRPGLRIVPDEQPSLALPHSVEEPDDEDDAEAEAQHPAADAAETEEAAAAPDRSCRASHRKRNRPQLQLREPADGTGSSRLEAENRMMRQELTRVSSEVQELRNRFLAGGSGSANSIVKTESR
ncbi:hypothetical protein BOX15_Mlig009286g2 [Macrostomum lignano]|uniref:BZIP domain-containing protein n=1 Tax=Macrostomum lignano TaxID=282301 RepID=A0A267DEG6_9PLAT|nr:hypothetical protein BOX15_Mlig009286g2 [Macrostomum lignano]